MPRSTKLMVLVASSETECWRSISTPRRILDLVRQLRRRRAYRGECFGATQGTFHFVGFGDVNQRQNLSVLALDFQRRRINIKRARGPVRVEVPTPSISGRLDVRS